MNYELITLNEVVNSGQSIYFYQDEMSNVWTTWGYSSYLLSHTDGVKCLTSFFDKMQMPCACITAADFERIVKDNMSTIENKNGIYILLTNEKVDANAYQNWVTSLK
jgi:hypothetical protein